MGGILHCLRFWKQCRLRFAGYFVASLSSSRKDFRVEFTIGVRFAESTPSNIRVRWLRIQHETLAERDSNSYDCEYGTAAVTPPDVMVVTSVQIRDSASVGVFTERNQNDTDN